MTYRCQRVLVVDRDPDFQTGLAQALRRNGVATLSVSGSDLALRAIEDGFKPDAILIDFEAEDTCCAEFLRRAKSTSAVPVIATLAEAHPVADRARGGQGAARAIRYEGTAHGPGRSVHFPPTQPRGPWQVTPRCSMGVRRVSG